VLEGLVEVLAEIVIAVPADFDGAFAVAVVVVVAAVDEIVTVVVVAVAGVSAAVAPVVGGSGSVEVGERIAWWRDCY
jgi:hypothetical protein